ncbi:MAG TPA: Hpt domain-containing protein [Casimicrobiaceae bacterium]|nr:Hpt domain-containing protein [Casimicrobiaceae bacterium]
MADDTIDVSTFRSLQDAAGAAFVADLVKTFFEEAPRMLDTLRDALRAGDRDEFRRAAHSLKSNGQTFGAAPLAAMARTLEQDAGVIVARGDAGPLDAVAAEYRRVASTLARLIDA